MNKKELQQRIFTIKLLFNKLYFSFRKKKNKYETKNI